MKIAGFVAFVASIACSGCWVVIPIGTAGQAARDANLMGGSHCVSESVTVGQVLPMGNGKRLRVEALHGRSAACTGDKWPIRASGSIEG